jgi:urea transport system permease protein
VAGFYPLIALPVAFLITGGIGMALERTIIRHLYGRPLETLLATWGISLMLIQLVRMLFGAQNLEVANPAWLSGGLQVLPNLILPWNRLAVLGFVLLVLFFTWLILNKTRLGMNVRAVTQNRAMAACCGVPTGRVDMLAFGLGSGIAGLGAWRCRSWVTSVRSWVRAISSTHSWWWCLAASASWREAWWRLLAWDLQQNPRTAARGGAGQDPDSGADHSVYSETSAGAVCLEREGY